MDDQNSHGFVPVDLTYDDDLLNSTGWSTPGNSQFHYSHNSQDQYASFQGPLHIGQPSYDHFSINPQSTFNTLSYDNSQYGDQFQRSSDVFAPSFSIDVSIPTQQNYHQHNRSFAFTPQSNEDATISPQTLQYNITHSQDIGNNEPNIGFKPTTNGLSNDLSQPPQENAIYYDNTRNLPNIRNDPSQYSNIPSSIQEINNLQFSSNIDNGSPTIVTSPHQIFKPKPAQTPKTLLRITRPDLYEAKNTSTRTRFDYAPFVAWEDTPIKITVGLKNTLPKYHARKSRSGKDLIPGFDVSKSLSPAQISTRKHNRTQTVKDSTSSLNRYKGTSQKPRIFTSKTRTLLEDESLKATKSQPESSSSEDETTSESESEYDEEIPLVDVSEIRGSNRPSDLSQAARWDTIGLIWRDPNSNPNADSIKDAIEKYANFVSALRIKIKSNSTQIEAELRSGETAKLQAERRVLLECLYQTISAASEFGYGPIVENLGGHHKLVNGLTTTLIECIKADDFVGKLPKAVFELLAKFKTLTDELLRKLKFDSIQKRWNKKGDEQTKKIISSILSNTADAKERLAKTKKDVEEKKSRDKDGLTKIKDILSSASSNPSKRPHEGDASDGKPIKKTSSDMANSAAIARSLIPKRGLNNLLGISTKPIVKAASKKRDTSPPSESKLGALLASIAKDPDPPRAPDVPMRAPETQQEKARRERKEGRRHLRVKFKEGFELEEVRLFKHEIAEDEGRQDEMLRDAHDDRLEGMMHKKRVTEAMDDDEDYQPSEAELPYLEPPPINLGSTEKISRFGKIYSTRGGGLNINSSEVQRQEKRESLELMVIYTSPADIPSSPKEPSSLGIGGITQSEHCLKDPTEPWLVQRLEDIHRYGPEHALHIYLLQNKSLAGRQNSTSEILSVLQQLSGVCPKPTIRPPEAPIDHTALATLFSWAKYLSGKPYPATEPPEWMTPEAKIGWLEGYNRDMSAKNSSSGQISGSTQSNQIPGMTSSMMNLASYQQALSSSHNLPQPIYPSSVSDLSQQAQGYLSTYPSGENHLSAHPNIDYSNWSTQVAKAHNDSQLSANQDLPQRWENDRQNENTRSNQFDGFNIGVIQRGYEQQFFDPKPKYNSLFDENGDYKGKKKPCRFWAEGKCAKGSKCTFLHT